MDDLTFWFLARITGLTAFAVLSLSVLSGEALRTSVLDFLASNRAIRKLHDFTTPLWLPLVFAHIMITIPWTVRLVGASLMGFDRTIEEAAQNLGAGPWTTFRRVTLPLIRPGVVAAALFGFVISFGNLEMTLFLIGPGRTTLPIAILPYLEGRIDPVIAAVSLLQILVIGTAMIVTDRYVKLARVL